jgi:MFS superfamily sulfate permease-like transporter
MRREELTFNYWKQDLPAGLVVFLIAIPLCLGIALASGAPLFSGIIAGFAGGIVVTLFSGSQLGVSGPAAGLAVIVLDAITGLGSFTIFLQAVVLAGILQFLMGVARAGIIAHYFPSSVIKGMLAAIGLILIMKQIPHALGDDRDPEGDMFFEQPDDLNTFTEILYALEHPYATAVLISLVSLLILLLWERPFFKKNKIFTIVQGPLVVVILGIIANGLLLRYSPQNAISPEHLVGLPVADSFSGFFSHFTIPNFDHILSPQVWKVAAVIALVASLETLLCVEATDKLDPHRRITPGNRELKAQGIGNVVSGLLGGLPLTQVVVRSSANINAGGETKLSALFHGILIFLAAALFPGIMNQIPYASLAAILLMVGYKLAKVSLFRDMYSKGWTQFVPFLVTVVSILLTDLLIGISIGLGVAAFTILLNNYKLPFHQAIATIDGKAHYVILMSEDVSFLNKGRILRALNEIPDNSCVAIDMSQSVNVDQDVLEILEDFKRTAKERNITFDVLRGKPQEEAQRRLKKQMDRRIFGGR